MFFLCAGLIAISLRASRSSDACFLPIIDAMQIATSTAKNHAAINLKNHLEAFGAKFILPWDFSKIRNLIVFGLAQAWNCK